MDPAPTTVVHVVGEADTGLENPRALDEPARRQRLAAWTAELAEAAATSSAATRRLLRQGRPGEAGGLQQHHVTPLAGLLDAVETTDPVALVLVAGPEGSAGVPNGTVARALADALAAHPDGLGTAVAGVEVVVAAGFDDDAAAGAVCAALEDGAGPVVMSWGSGSTTIALSALAGVVESARPWTLRSSYGRHAEVVLRPAGRADALAPWLFRLGYLGRLVELADAGRLDPPPDPHMVQRAREGAERLTRVARGSTDVADLAEWVRTDLRRRDATSAIAVRAWLAAGYARQRSTDPARPVDLLAALRRTSRPNGSGASTLGDLLRWAEPDRAPSPAVRRSLDSHSGRWLLVRLAEVNAEVSRSAHELRRLPARTVDRLHTRLPAEHRAGLPGPATGVVHVLWPAAVRGAGPSPAVSLLEAGLGYRVYAAAGADGPAGVELRATIVASTPESHAFADEQVAELTGASGYRRVVAAVVSGGDPAAAQAAVSAHLAAARRDPEVMVVLPVGPKPMVAAVFTAAVAHGRDRAVPVFVECTDRDRTAVAHHRVAAYLTVDAVVVDLAAEAVARVELDTAARLLDLGSPGAQACADRAAALGRALTAAVADRRTAALLDLFRAAWHVADDDTARLRLIHLAGTVAPQGTVLHRVRNLLSIAHGKHSPTSALRASGVPGTVEHALDDAVAGAGGSYDTLTAAWHALRAGLDHLAADGGGR